MNSKQNETAIFAAGCFWHIQDLFDKVPGVTGTLVGYTGGKTQNPGYKEVCGGATGHAESIKIEYDPAEVSYEKLLGVFWGCHDPTTKDRQGADVGSQYRSAIFYTSERQKEQAEASRQTIADRHSRPVVTEIVRAGDFHNAEEYHQKYFEKTHRSR